MFNGIAGLVSNFTFFVRKSCISFTQLQVYGCFLEPPILIEKFSVFVIDIFGQRLSCIS